MFFIIKKENGNHNSKLLRVSFVYFKDLKISSKNFWFNANDGNVIGRRESFSIPLFNFSNFSFSINYALDELVHKEKIFLTEKEKRKLFDYLESYDQGEIDINTILKVLPQSSKAIIRQKLKENFGGRFNRRFRKGVLR